MGVKDGAVQDALLTQHSNGLFNDDNMFISEQILPPVAVGPTTGKIGKYSGGHLRVVNTSHTGKGGYLEVETLVFDSDGYDIKEHGLKEFVTDKQKRNAVRPFNALEDATINLTSLQMIAKERALALVLTDPAVLTQGATLAGNAQYNNRDHADSNPIEDRITAFGVVEDAAGVTPNTAIMNQKVARALRFHHQMLEVLGFTRKRPNGLTMEELAEALEVDRVLIGRALYNTAKEGQTDAFSPIWPNDLIYAFIAPFAGLRMKTLGVEVRKSGTTPRAVFRKEMDEPVGSTKIIVIDNYDQIILNASTAYLLQDVIA